jgi:hypothetical protein
MFCRGCNTRIDEGARSCPNCGRTLTRIHLGGQGPASQLTPGKPTPLPPPTLPPDEVELDAPAGAPAAAASRQTAPAPARASDGVLAALDPRGLRELLAANADLLEPGLRPLADERGAPVGVGYVSGVGEIDLLGVDAGGGLVAALVAEGNEKGGDLVAAILTRIGWVKKHVAQPGQEVRGLVLVQSPPEGLGYTAAAVSDTVAFKTYRLSILLEDVEF